MAVAVAAAAVPLREGRISKAVLEGINQRTKAVKDGSRRVNEIYLAELLKHKPELGRGKDCLVIGLFSNGKGFSAYCPELDRSFDIKSVLGSLEIDADDDKKTLRVTRKDENGTSLGVLEISLLSHFQANFTGRDWTPTSIEVDPIFQTADTAANDSD